MADTLGNIAIDGSTDDWKGAYWSQSEIRTPGTGVARQLRVAIAPRRDELLLCLGGLPTKGGFPTGWDAIQIDLSVGEVSGELVQLVLERNRVVAWTRHEDAVAEVKLPRGAARYVCGAGLELSVDLRALVSDANLKRSADWVGPRQAPWMRAMVSLLVRAPGGRSEKEGKYDSVQGPMVASYRLCPESFAPRWAHEIPAEEPHVKLPFFVSGLWWVTQGPDNWPTHGHLTAYDFGIADSRGRQFRGSVLSRNEDCYAWDKPVYAPSGGAVSEVWDGSDDGVPSGSESPTVTGRGNGIRAGNAQQWAFHHLRRDSIGMTPGQAVRQGDIVGRVGNSGISTGPHLHVEVFKSGSSIPTGLILTDVSVGLNSDPSDPWIAVLPDWEVECGYFVQTSAPSR